ncbi:MAG TPA: hypothetical protein VLG76_04155 [Rhabdochlamydiaceae bacterium]|nr:hypothetical protein [Rhabdochlamydiaceae bacterium]
MQIHFDEKNTARVGDVESKTPPTERVSLVTARNSLETMAMHSDGFLGRANIFFNGAQKFILSVVNSFLVAVGIKQKPPKNTDLPDEVYRKLDELIKHPDQFAAALGVYVPPSQRGNLQSINLKVYAGHVPLFKALCHAEGRYLRFDNGKIIITPRVIEYVLKNARGLDLRATGGDGYHIFSMVHSEEVLRLLLDHDPSLITHTAKSGKTALFYNVEYQPGKTIEECRRMVQLLISRGAKLDLKDLEGNSVLHFCKDRATARFLLQADPTLVFARNKRYESPIDTAPLALEPYLTQFAEAHYELDPRYRYPNKSLEIAVGKAVHADLREPEESSMTLERDRILIKSDRGKPIGETFETLETARILIEAGADVSTQVKFGVNGTQSVLDCIIMLCHREAWQRLLPIAIKKATQEQIHSSLKTTLFFALNKDDENHWIRSACALISASKAPCKDLRICKVSLNLDRQQFVPIEKSLEAWDREKRWGLFSD